MDKEVEVTFINNNSKIVTKKVPFGTHVYNLLDNFDLPAENIYAVKINNEVRPLDNHLQFFVILI